MRPFQEAVIKALDTSSELIVVDAPVGAGKSHIARKLVQRWNGAIVLTYPTKILMDAQRRSLKDDFPGSVVWPFESGVPVNQSPTIFYYSTDALMAHLKKQGVNYRLDRSQLLDKILHQHFYATKSNVVVTSPDVLHLLFTLQAYRGSRRLATFFPGAVVVFDEFHLYAGLKHFPTLIENLLASGVKKIILLSATPVFSEETRELTQKYTTERIGFDQSSGGSEDVVFNYPLQLEFVSCRYTRNEELMRVLRQYVPILAKPMAIILDSIFRLRRLMPILKSEFGDKWRIVEYSGFYHNQVQLDDRTILVGTSSIEVGINMAFKSLITEAAYWTSAIQRIGRVGRFCDGTVIVLTTKNMEPFVSSRSKITRDELEQEILQSALKDLKMSHVCGDMFRGDSYPFLIFDGDSHLLTTYTESIFSMYEAQRWVNDWQTLDYQEKVQQLERYVTSKEIIEEILLKDKLVPFWGVVEGRLRDRYEKISVRLVDQELTVICEDSNRTYCFEGRS